MSNMFRKNTVFNQDLSEWDVSGLTKMDYMFSNATAFDQHLGWCITDGVTTSSFVSGSGCEEETCGIEVAANCNSE